MKKFNLKREQRKLWLRQHKSQIIKIGSGFLCGIILTVAVLYFSKADFSTTVTFDVIDAHVTPFTTGDVKLTYNINGVDSDTIMNNDGTKYKLSNYTCDNSEVLKWNNDTWSVNISNMSGKVKCKLYFETLIDQSGAAAPELYDALIPVVYEINNDTVTYKVADTTQEWYNYGKDTTNTTSKWANAVLVDSSKASSYTTAGTEITESDILQMYVWIPRYKYKLFNTNNESKPEQMIEIEFENCNAENGVCTNSNYQKQSGSTNNTWLTHPAFTFGSTELNGFWVGKFETAYNGTGNGQANGILYVGSDNGLFTCTNETCSNASNIRILPNVNPLRRETVSNMYYISRSIASNGGVGLSTSKTDSHMMKNMEWGAVAYLTNSKYGRYIDSTTCTSGGCEVWINPYINDNTLKTGCAGTNLSAYSETTCNAWNTTNGVHASTIDNMYGIYDMSGGSYEYVMGNMKDSSGNFYSSNAGFSSAPNTKYYDSYNYDGSYSGTYQRGKLGDATREIIKKNSGYTTSNPSEFNNGWNGDWVVFPYSSSSWFVRGGYWRCGDDATAGIYHTANQSGSSIYSFSFRIVLSAP